MPRTNRRRNRRLRLRPRQVSQIQPKNETKIFELVSNDWLSPSDAYVRARDLFYRIRIHVAEIFPKDPYVITTEIYHNKFLNSEERHTVVIAQGTMEKIADLAQQIRDALPNFKFTIREKM